QGAKKSSILVLARKGHAAPQGIFGSLVKVRIRGGIGRSGLFEGLDLLKQGEIEIHLYRVAADLEVFELAPVHGDGAFGLSLDVLRVESGSDAVGGEDVQHVQALERGGDQRVVALVVALVAARDVRVALFEGDELAEAEVLDARAAVAAGGRQG